MPAGMRARRARPALPWLARWMAALRFLPAVEAWGSLAAPGPVGALSIQRRRSMRWLPPREEAW
eukprot:9632710-Alexandrium_andersonii.AAC.1